MLWKKRKRYSIEEFALLMGGFDPIHVASVKDAEHASHYSENGPADWETSKHWYALLLEAIEDQEISDEDLYIALDIGRYDPWEGFAIQDLDTSETKITKKALVQWLEELNIRLPYFLLSTDELFQRAAADVHRTTDNQAFKEELEAEAKVAGCDFMQPVQSPPRPALPEDLKQIQILLNGEHEHQAYGLELAIKAWLGVSHLYKQNLGSAASPKGDVKAWLDDNAEELGLTQKERIASLVNWSKSGGRPKGEE